MRTRQPNTEWLPAGGQWWRFSGYEIRDRVIRPAAGSQLEAYDPWELYRATRIRGDEWIPPYAEFVNLRNQLGPSIKESEKHILQWCGRYGLPGVLLHQVRLATLAPRWVFLEEGASLLVPSQLTFFRTNKSWTVKRTLFRPASIELRRELKGQPVPQEMAPEAWARIGVVRQNLRSTEISNEGLRDTWWKFFPDVPSDLANDYAYAAPLSARFCREYAEPYGEFLNAVQCLGEALWRITHHKSKDEISPSDTENVGQGVALLEALLAPTSPSIVPMSDGKFSQRWACGSLLSAFAMMALQDLTESRRVRNCESCGRLFISQHPAALYCSPPCRWKFQKRRQRGDEKKPIAKLKASRKVKPK